MPIALDVTTFPRDVSIAAGASASAYFDIRGAKRGMVYVPNPWTAASIAFYGQQRSAANQVSGAVTPAKMRGKTGTLLRIDGIQATEAGWYEIPGEVFTGPGWISLVSTATGSEAAVNQTSARALKVVLVS